MSVIEVGTWVSIQDGCPIEYQVTSSSGVEFHCGTGSNGFDFGFECEALRAFVELAGAALADMDTRFAQEQAADQTPTG